MRTATRASNTAIRCHICLEKDEVKPISLFLIENNEILRQALRDIISKAEEFEISGEEDSWDGALIKLKAYKPDIVLVSERAFPIFQPPILKIKNFLAETRFALLLSEKSQHQVLQRYAQGFDGIINPRWNPLEWQRAIHFLHHQHWLLPRGISRSLIRQVHGSGRLLAQAAPYNLTEMEMKVLRVLRQEKTGKETAEALAISINTLKSHLKHIFHKMNVRNRTDAVIKTVLEEII